MWLINGNRYLRQGIISGMSFEALEKRQQKRKKLKAFYGASKALGIIIHGRLAGKARCMKAYESV